MDNPAPPKAANEVPLDVFREAVEQSALAISITDTQARILYSNPAFNRVTGFAAEEVGGRTESILSYKVTPKIVYETMWAQLLRQRPWNGLLVNRRKDGSRYLAELTITPVVDEAGETTHYLGMHRDVTEVNRLERQVQNQKALIESVVDAAQVAIVVLDEKERVVLDNQEYKKLVGDLGTEPALTILAALRTRMGPAFEQARTSGRGFSGREIQLDTSRYKTRWFACSGSWIEEQDTSADAFYEPHRLQYMLLTLQDITPLKEQQDAIRVNALSALLAEQERIESLREVLSGAVYQLQGPFNMLAAAVRLLERNGNHGPADPLLASLQEALKAGSETLNTLRATIPSEANEAVQPVNLNELIQDVLRITTPKMLAEGVVVEWHPAHELPALQGRLRQLSTLFKQLLDNAVEAIHESRAGRRELKVATFAHPDRIEVLIEDSGPGIPEEWRLKIFQPFFTTKGADRQHIGMGLTVAQEIVASHGGLIEIDPEYPNGCRVRVQFLC
ncbi:MAG: nitrogen fixation negative regulator NifL [Thiobacillaceae bacterium]